MVDFAFQKDEQEMALDPIEQVHARRQQREDKCPVTYSETRNFSGAALAIPDDDVAQPTRQVPGSFTAQVAALNVEECAAKCWPAPQSALVLRLCDELPAMREQVRNACTSAVKAAKERIPGSNYRVEVGEMVSSGSRLYVLAVVTRIA